jgi:protein-S-isoprenylcysteine O-methyltransferase Ste14
MNEPRWITNWRALALAAIVVIALAFVVALLQADVSGLGKTIGIVGVLFVAGGGFIRIWLASRPYGLGAWDQREQSTTGESDAHSETDE